VQSIPELEVMGSPEMSVVAVQAREPSKLNIYKLNDLMEKVCADGEGVTGGQVDPPPWKWCAQMRSV